MLFVAQSLDLFFLWALEIYRKRLELSFCTLADHRSNSTRLTSSICRAFLLCYENIAAFVAALNTLFVFIDHHQLATACHPPAIVVAKKKQQHKKRPKHIVDNREYRQWIEKKLKSTSEKRFITSLWRFFQLVCTMN